MQYWQEEELKTLIGSPLLGEAQTRAHYKDDFNRLKQVLYSGDSPVMSEEEFTFEHFSWAVGNVFARSYYYPFKIPVPWYQCYCLDLMNSN